MLSGDDKINNSLEELKNLRAITMEDIEDMEEVGEIVYNKLDRLEAIVQDLYLANTSSDSYKLTKEECSSFLNEAESLIADLMKVNKDTHYRV
jgi:chromosome segregation ATPase